MLCKLRKFKKKYRFFRNGEKKVLVRKSDNTLWIASHNGTVHSMLALIGEGNKFYFRRCKPFMDGYIIDWDQVWEHNSGSLFEFMDRRK